jgi:long-chain acyl-CoA synthetase
MRRHWLSSYPPSVRPHIDLQDDESINEVVARTCRKYPDKPAFRSMDVTMTYGQLDALSRSFAAGLQSLPGLARGSRVALMMPNLLQYPVALLGVLRAGMIAVNVNPLYTARELDHQLRDAECQAIVVLENFASTLAKALANQPQLKHVITTSAGELLPVPRRWLVNLTVRHVKKSVPPWSIPDAIAFRTVLAKGARRTFSEAQPRSEDIAFLQYTGGTTGVSKGAILTHGNIVANLLQAEAWAAEVLTEGCEVAITALPLYHIFSLTISCLLFTKLGGLQVLIANPRDLASIVAAMRKVPFTVMTGVNTLFNGLLNTPGFSDLDFSHLRFSIGGGAAVHPSVAAHWESVTGRPLIEGYGLTEASPLVACNPLDSRFSGLIGLPMPSTDIAIRDDDGRDLAPGLQGEVCVRGPQVTQGYWNKPEETLNTLTPDGWLRTGDLGIMDERGYIRLTDRKKDMILVSGFNVYPNEIESVISAMPGVAECAVVGVPHPVTGEVVKAFVVAREEISAESVINFCREHLTAYKTPRLVVFRSELPKNPIGKVLRRELRTEELAATITGYAAAGITTGTISSRSANAPHEV